MRDWHKSTFGSETLHLGPFYLVARSDGFTVSLFRPSGLDDFKTKEGLALGVKASKKAALREARDVLRKWIDEIDRLLGES